ncbi:hypothetical protein Hdeb2414_s0011g00373871 [Helianthus debilis subsp. tardiflorus]
MTHKSYTLSIYTLLPLHTLLAIFLRSINILEREIPLFRSKPVRSGVEPITICKVEMDAMEKLKIYNLIRGPVFQHQEIMEHRFRGSFDLES